MGFFQRVSKRITPGTEALFLIQIFATLSYAVLYSTLVLYTTKQLDFSAVKATALMGTFAAFNYGLHLLGGYLGGHFLSFRSLFCIGMSLQVIGCLTIAQLTISSLYIGLSFFLTGSGLNVTCINMMVTQLFEPHDKRREAAFLWNYSGMNLGFFVGFALAGYYQLKGNYGTLFTLASFANAIAILIAFIYWKKLKDRTTVLTSCVKSTRIKRNIIGLICIGLLLISLTYFLINSKVSNIFVLSIGAAMGVFILILAINQHTKMARHRMYAFIMLAIASLLFWTLYQLAPMGLVLFAQHNVDRHYFGFLIAPQWIQNINTIVIIIGGPLMNSLFQAARRKGRKISIPFQFTTALILIGIGFVVLPIGIKFANNEGLVNFNWILISYLCQSVGELFISPIGYAMVGQLAPGKLQGVMMGTWMMVTGVASVLASFFSNLAVKNADSLSPLVTNASYSHVFNLLGWGAIIGGFILAALIPLLHRLIQEPSNQT